MSERKIIRKNRAKSGYSYAVSRANLIFRQKKNESVEESLDKLEREAGQSGDAVLYTEQKLSEEQKSQARKNIDAIGTGEAVSSGTVNKIEVLTQQEYDAIAEPDPSTLYIIR